MFTLGLDMQAVSAPGTAHQHTSMTSMGKEHAVTSNQEGHQYMARGRCCYHGTSMLMESVDSGGQHLNLEALLSTTAPTCLQCVIDSQPKKEVPGEQDPEPASGKLPAPLSASRHMCDHLPVCASKLWRHDSHSGIGLTGEALSLPDVVTSDCRSCDNIDKHC